MKQYLIVFGCLLISIFNISNAQTNTKIGIGSDAPGLNVFRWLKGKPINEFKKGEAYLVEFGSTWCKPCHKMVSKLNAIVKKYGERITVVSVYVMEYNRGTLENGDPQYIRKVEQFLSKRGDEVNFNVAVDGPEKWMENKWLKSAGMAGIPYSFIVDKNGKIVWIGANPDLLDSAVSKVVYDENLLVSDTLSFGTRLNKANTTTSDNAILVRLNQRNNNLFYGSLLTSYIPGQFTVGSQQYIKGAVHSGSTGTSRDGVVNIIGESLGSLYFMAFADTFWIQVPTRSIATLDYPDTVRNPTAKRSYGEYWHKPIIELSGKNGEQLSVRYNYFLQIPEGIISGKKLQSMMRDDLFNLFGFDVKVEDRMMPYWSIRVSSPDKFKKLQIPSAGRGFNYFERSEGFFEISNGDMRDIVWMLGSNFGYKDYDNNKLPVDQQAPFIDETGYKGKINFTYDLNYSFKEVLSYLHDHGLNLHRSEKIMKTIVIRDRQVFD